MVQYALILALMTALITGCQREATPHHSLYNGKALHLNNGTIEVRHSDRWSVNEDIRALGGPILLNNFSSRYLPGGIIPPGGAEIVILRKPLDAQSQKDAVKSDAEDSKFVREEFINIEENKILLRTYDEEYTDDLVMQRSIGYVPLNDSHLRFSISYHKGDEMSEKLLSEFKAILSSTAVTK